MKEAKITPLAVTHYAKISEDICDEIYKVEYAGMIAAKCSQHPEYGDIVLVASTTHTDILMIHF